MTTALPKETLPATAIDPVCGMEVDPQTTALWHDHEGRRYFFCRSSC
ncbi:MAG TPA: hypothetical protein VGL15_14435 [Vicinamibacteria bacterium]|jgi:Cu+-exporting ATPase